MNSRTLLALPVALMLSSLLTTVAQAVPVQIDSALFTSAIAGLNTQVEDLESEALSIAPSFTLSNASYSSNLSDSEVYAGAPFCGAAENQCLYSRLTDGVRQFDAVPSDTAYFGLELLALQSSNTFQINVTGGSGVLSFTQSGADFLGFYDALGITSITFENLGSGNTSANYSFDNIVTAQLSAVPVPAAGWLFMSALVGLVGKKRLSS
jgi:hypothetical protein